MGQVNKAVGMITGRHEREGLGRTASMDIGRHPASMRSRLPYCP